MTKEQLRSYKQLKREKAQIENILKSINSENIAPPSIRYNSQSGYLHSNGSKPTENIAIKRYELMQIYTHKLNSLNDILLLIEDAIEKVEDSTERTLLRHYYIDGLKWDDVAKEMGYCLRTTHRIHARALRHISSVD